MSPASLASIIIACYNHGRFLKECIDSALNQTYPYTEVIVVDDGSTDNSSEIIASYGDRVIPVLKTNGGQASAFNAGFARIRGQVVCFLDADDTLLAGAVETAMKLFLEPGVAKVHWPLWTVDERDHRIGGMYPSEPLPEGDLRECVIRGGPRGYTWPMTACNAWARSFLERIFPVPEHEYVGSAESYLATLAPAYGPVRAIRQPLATYRLHADSYSSRRLVSETIRKFDLQRAALREGFRKLGIDVDPGLWPPPAETHHQILLACQELAALIPGGSKFIFVEWGVWGPGQIVAGCRQIPFLEKDGQYWGKSPDDATAIRELERLRESGASFIVFAWPAFWWLEHYSGFHRHLRSKFRCALENERLNVFDLRP